MLQSFDFHPVCNIMNGKSTRAQILDSNQNRQAVAAWVHYSSYGHSLIQGFSHCFI